MDDVPFHHRRLNFFDYAGRAAAAAGDFLRRDAVVVTAAAAVTVAVAVTLTAGFQLLSLTHPSRSAYAAKPSDFQLEYQPVTLVSDDGTPLAAWFVPARQPTRQALLVMHGYGSNKSEMLPRAAFLAERYNLLFLDFRYFGESGGTASTFGAREQRDAASAFAWLRQQGYDRLGAYGFGLGGTAALMALTAETDVRCAAAESPYGNMHLVLAGAYASFGPLKEPMADVTAALAARLGLDLSATHVVQSLRTVRQPALVIASRTDTIVPVGHLEAVRAGLSADPQAEYLEFDGRQHGEIAPGFAERMLAFFGRCL